MSEWICLLKNSKKQNQQNRNVDDPTCIAASDIESGECISKC